MLDERQHNYPKGYEKKPWCPYTDLVQVGASLAGIELTPERFCTETIENANYSDGLISWLKSGDFFPRVSCVLINRELIKQTGIVNKKIDLPKDEEIAKEIKSCDTAEDMLVVSRNFTELKENFAKRDKIVKRWRKVVFETCCATTEDQANKHFRQFKSADELTEEEVIGKVKQFTEALTKITGLTKEWNIIDGAENCKQSPKHWHFGAYH